MDEKQEEALEIVWRWYETSLIHFVLFLKRHFWFINLRQKRQMAGRDR